MVERSRNGYWRCGARGLVGKLYDVLEPWQEKAAKIVTDKTLSCGHFLPEEAPEESLAALLEFP